MYPPDLKTKPIFNLSSHAIKTRGQENSVWEIFAHYYITFSTLDTLTFMILMKGLTKILHHNSIIQT